jgi:hypothetical protein
MEMQMEHVFAVVQVLIHVPLRVVRVAKTYFFRAEFCENKFSPLIKCHIKYW